MKISTFNKRNGAKTLCALAVSVMMLCLLSSCTAENIIIEIPTSPYVSEESPATQSSPTLDPGDTVITPNDTPATPETPIVPTTPSVTPSVTPTPEKADPQKIELDKTDVTIYVGEDHTPKVTVLPANAENKSYTIQTSDKSVAIIKDGNTVSARGEGTCKITVISGADSSVKAEISLTVLHTPEGQITYIEGILIANKTFALPEDYDPDIQTDAKKALDKMIAAAKKDGIKLWICSGYRDYATQKRIYNNYVNKDGKEKADTYSARPGHSEHQTGLAFDLNRADSSFNGTPEALWIAAHAHEYGFIVRYPEGKQDITGYKYEPWHVRYLGVEISEKVYASGLTLEEYLGITSEYRD